MSGSLAFAPGPLPVAALRTEGLDVGYKTRTHRRVVLEGVNVTARMGDLVCVLGPNGVGKSTLLRTCARMQPLLRGRVYLGGADAVTLTGHALAKQVGVVLAERVPSFALPVRRVVEIGRYVHSGWFGGMGVGDATVVSWAMAAAGVEQLGARPFAELSDGERQRTMIARALVQEPSLLLLDEPTTFLDTPSRVGITLLLRQLARRGNLAVVATSHDVETALRIADVIWLVLPSGQIVVGAPEDVVASGSVANTFADRRLQFQSETQRFAWTTDHVGTARVSGEGAMAALARAVCEREGYRLVVDPDINSDIEVTMTPHGWRAANEDGVGEGGDFASLAAYVRGSWTCAQRASASAAV